MKSGITTVNLDGSTYNFYFSKSGGVEGKGRGLSGVDDEKYIYMYGCRIKADSDDKFQIVEVKSTGTAGDIALGSDSVVVAKESSRDIRNASKQSKTPNKDGADWYLYVDKNQRIVMYTNNKNLNEARDAVNKLLTTWNNTPTTIIQ